MGMGDLLKMVLLTVFFVSFAAIGVAHIVNPDWFIRRSGVRKGGDLLTEWNRLQFRMGGVAFTAFGVYMLYVLLTGRHQGTPN